MCNEIMYFFQTASFVQLLFHTSSVQVPIRITQTIAKWLVFVMQLVKYLRSLHEVPLATCHNLPLKEHSVPKSMTQTQTQTSAFQSTLERFENASTPCSGRWAGDKISNFAVKLPMAVFGGSPRA